MENEMGLWKIYRHVGLESPVLVGILPRPTTKPEVAEVLKRLVCKNLTEQEILLASLRKNNKQRTNLLDPIGSSSQLQFGEDPFYTAIFEAL
jgi:hypothetical protein